MVDFKKVKIKYFEIVFLILSLSIIVGGTGILGYWYFYPYKPMEIKSIVINTPTVQKGGTLSYTIDYCKYLDLPGTSSKQLIDNSIIFLPPIETNNPVGCDKGVRYVELPHYAEADSYILRISITYRVNPIRLVTVVAESNKFQIIK